MAISTTYVSSVLIKSKQLEDQKPKDVKGLIENNNLKVLKSNAKTSKGQSFVRGRFSLVL
jgi:hypothetical protein